MRKVGSVGRISVHGKAATTDVVDGQRENEPWPVSLLRRKRRAGMFDHLTDCISRLM